MGRKVQFQISRYRRYSTRPRVVFSDITGEPDEVARFKRLASAVGAHVSGMLGEIHMTPYIPNRLLALFDAGCDGNANYRARVQMPNGVCVSFLMAEKLISKARIAA